MSNEFKHLQYTYTSELDIEPGENCKILHSAKHQDGTEISLDFSPYEKMNFETFQMLVEMNFPKRQGCGPLGKDSVMKLFIAFKQK